MATHGQSRTAEFRIWSGIKTRCFNPNDATFKNYGGRGIVMVPRWRDSFAEFIGDMGPRPSPMHCIERVDNDGDYEPGNCIWIEKREQARNTRRSVFLSFRGKRKLLVDWARELGIKPGTIRMRLKRRWSPAKALGTALIDTGRWT